MKDIHEVKDTQPLSFNHGRCRGVAARAGSVHLIYSMDRKLGWKGGARTPTTAPSCSSRMPILQEILTDHRKSTNNAISTAQPGQHQKAHNDVPPQPRNPLPAWVEQIHNQQPSPLPSSQTVSAIPPGSSTSLAN